MLFRNIIFILLISIVFGFNVDFVMNYFNLKSISIITLFTCNENTVLMAKKLMKGGFRISFQNMEQYNSFDLDYILFNYNHEGIVIDPTCAGAQRLITRAGILHKFTDLQYWLFIQDKVFQNDFWKSDSCEEQLSNLGHELLSNASIYPNSQVIWAQESRCTPDNNDNLYSLFDVYRISPATGIRTSFVGFYPGKGLEQTFSVIPTIGSRRRNFHKVVLRAGYVVQFQKKFTYMYDLHKRGVEPFLKRGYPQMIILKQDLNFSTNYSIADGYGWIQNGSNTFDGGLMKLFQNNEIDFAMHGLLMRRDRFKFVDFSAELIQVTARMIFRQPPLSSVSNIYLLPFDKTVWISCVGLILLIASIISFQFYCNRSVDDVIELINSLDLITFISGAVCQQGFSLSPSTASTRITMLLLFISSLFLFTSYSATIVALLQTPSTELQTLADLVRSPLNVGIQNITYNVVFITESQHPITRKLYKEKVLPKGPRGFLEVSEGVELVRRGMYAFQVDTGAAYDIISATYTEIEKCGLGEIELYQLPMQVIPLAYRSPYRDIFTIRLRWQREIGIQDRTFKIWVPQRPKCEASRGGFVSVGLTEFAPTLKALLFGGLFAMFILFIELSWTYRQNLFKFLKLFHNM